MREANTEEEQTAIQRVIDLINDIGKNDKKAANLPKCPIGAMVIVTFENRLIAVTNYGHMTPRDVMSVLMTLKTEKRANKPQVEIGIAR